MVLCGVGVAADKSLLASLRSYPVAPAPFVFIAENTPVLRRLGPLLAILARGGEGTCRAVLLVKDLHVRRFLDSNGSEPIGWL